MNGATLLFGGGKVVDYRTKLTIGYGSEDLYLFAPVVKIPSAATVLATLSSPDYHARLGHPHPRVLRILGFSSSVPATLCPACAKGKSTKTVPKVSQSSTTAPLQLLHADVTGPFPVPGLHDERYFLTIVDDFTRWTAIFPLGKKSDVSDSLKQFILSSENHFSCRGLKVVNIRTDNGGEFCCSTLDTYFKNKGICHQLTVPYNSFQNGVAERKHRTIEDKVRTLLASSNLSETFWVEAVATAEFLLNRTPSPLSAVSSFEKWYGLKPDYSVWRPFGCQVYALIASEKRSSKFAPVVHQGVFVGYSPVHRAYKVYIPSFHQTYVSNQCRFGEGIFPTVESFAAANNSVSSFGTPTGSLYYGSTTAAIPGNIEAVPTDLPARSLSSPIHSSVPEGVLSLSPVGSSVISSPVNTSPTPENLSDRSPSVPLLLPAPDTHETTSPHYALRFPAVAPVLTPIPSTSASLSKRPYSPSVLVEPDLKKAALYPIPASETKRDVVTAHLPPLSHEILKRGRFDVSNFVHTVLYSGISLTASIIPETVTQALESSDASRWKYAIKKEMDAHTINRTWDLVDLPAGRRAIGCRWVFTVKDSTTPPTYKARLVAQGFRQVYGLDYSETFSPVIRYESIRLLFSVAAEFAFPIHQMDVTTAFLNGDLDEEIYLNQPDGVWDAAASSKVCRLRKSLYGLKQAPLCWNMKINSVLEGAGFSRAPSEFGIYSFVRGSSLLLLALYVDDLLILSNDIALIQSTKDLLSSHFSMKDLGPVTSFLGMNVTQESGRVSLSLSTYLAKLLAQFQMTDCNSVSVPLSPSLDLTSFDSAEPFSEISRYRSLVGKLLFAANTVRPDLSFSVSVLSRYLKDPKGIHMKAVKQVLRYIRGTLNHGLLFKKVGNFQLVGFSDSDWASDTSDRRSTSGYVFKTSNGPISWRSKKQTTVALSSAEAEYMALGDAVKELIWLRQLVSQVAIKLNTLPIIYEDNNSCIQLAEHPAFHGRSKHIDIRHHFVRTHLSKKEFQLLHVDTNNMVADIFTKPLSKVKFRYLRDLLGVVSI